MFLLLSLLESDKIAGAYMQKEGYFGMVFVILYSGLMTMTIPELFPSQNFLTTPAVEHLETTYGATFPMRDRSSVESCFEPGARSRDLTSGPPRP
ncbi:hypothetical protein AVEN_33492-1 [Araneus ventricosus]|uniref:Uncharacterized protein n=1 Tax=Araneus ventricosus TaxID=182803 RepID=A0A4Y2GUP3_ARAVE|nr:hypothetical protein AVEN_33492-1 [Araneus ventricosus]